MNTGEKDAATENTEEASRPVPINTFRGRRSATNMVVISPNTMPSVENETARLLSLAVSEKSRARSGSNGWK